MTSVLIVRDQPKHKPFSHLSNVQSFSFLSHQLYFSALYPLCVTFSHSLSLNKYLTRNFVFWNYPHSLQTSILLGVVSISPSFPVIHNAASSPVVEERGWGVHCGIKSKAKCRSQESGERTDPGLKLQAWK